MTPTAETIWSALEFRTPMMLRNVEPLGDAQMRRRPLCYTPPVRSGRGSSLTDR